MAYKYYNSNPYNKIVGDCVIRALAAAFGIPWVNAYTELAIYGLEKGDIPSSNNLWGSYLKENGYRVVPLPDTCPNCYTVRQFAEEHPHGTYILATGNHVVACISGDYIDSWDSGDEIVAYYFEKRE